MALKYLSNIDLNGNQLRGASIEPLSNLHQDLDHLVLLVEVIYYNTSENKLKIILTFIKVGATYSFRFKL